VVVVIGAAALMGATTAAFAGASGSGRFAPTAAGIAAGFAAHAGRAAGVIFAIALLDASIIGAFAVSLSTAYAIGDVLGLKHSLHRGVAGAKGFYAVYAGVIACAAAIVLIPGSPLGLLTEGVQTLAGVLLPSATAFLLLLCNDREVLGPWVNGRKTNVFSGAVIAVLIALSVVLTASVAFPNLGTGQIFSIMACCGVVGLAVAGYWLARLARSRDACALAIDRTGRESWRMPPLNLLTRPVMTSSRKVGMSAMWLYLAVAMTLVVVKVVQLALGH
jgi:Natural resistance-associated macrophage protein-like